MDDKQMREAFEAWHKRASWYGDEPAAWEAWKAGIAVGMERAAGICAEKARQWDNPVNGTAGYAAEICACSIRTALDATVDAAMATNKKENN